MASTARAFRGSASLEAEQITRDAVVPFLQSLGWQIDRDDRKVTGTAQSQVISARTSDGSSIRARVRLCWRWEDGPKRYSAAQLRARVLFKDWDKTLTAIVERDEVQGVSHALFIQRYGANIEFAALVPIGDLGKIWSEQRKVSASLISRGLSGRIRKNHAENGGSPTIWLMDQRFPGANAVTNVLWTWPGVVDLVSNPALADIGEDTLDDVGSKPDMNIGSDGSTRTYAVRSMIKRDSMVRAEVIKRATTGCEYVKCKDDRKFAGFLDVHHVFGVENSDRVWTCVALCPSCHRTAHYGPDQESINAALAEFAGRFAPSD